MRRGLVRSRGEARDAVAAGRVTVAGAPVHKPARLVAAHEPVALRGPGPRFVGRGGEKLDAALLRFEVDVAGRHALDVGASTGGFTDCLLQRGAASVTAVDVGRAQLHERLRRDPRVRSLERRDARTLRSADMPTAPGVLVVDVSFISLAAVLSPVVALVAPAGDVVALVKPQFEAGRAEATRGRGVITDPAVWVRTLSSALVTLERSGAAIMGAMPSPLTGAQGNVEFLIHGRVGLDRAPLEAVPGRLDALARSAVDEAVGR